LRDDCGEGEKDDSPAKRKETLCHGPIATPIAPHVNAENEPRILWVHTDCFHL
jgi:hypothetical protein